MRRPVEKRLAERRGHFQHFTCKVIQFIMNSCMSPRIRVIPCTPYDIVLYYIMLFCCILYYIILYYDIVGLSDSGLLYELY